MNKIIGLEKFNFHIYIIATYTKGPVKIGFSHHPPSRLKEIQTGNPDKLRLCGSLSFKKKMIRAYTEYEMQISEGYLTGIHNENEPYEIRIVLNRYNLELNVNFFNNGSWDFNNSYKTTCRKTEKKI